MIAERGREGKGVIEVRAGEPIRAVGLMSGTSLDGIDIAEIDTDGEQVFGFGPAASHPMPGEAAAAIRATFGWEPAPQAAALVDRLHASAIAAHPSGAAVVGYHGQTVAHDPDRGRTRQLGDGVWLAREAGLPVVWDFRTQDMAAGGQGAPLVPVYHFALAQQIGATEPLAFLNIGGVANLTWVDPSKAVPTERGALVAFDTGPGNALVNDWMAAHTGTALDRNGEAAAAGRVQAGRVSLNSGASYLGRSGPKSLDRNDFHGALAAVDGLSVEDGAATLTALTADCVAESVAHLPSPPARWLVCGGGRLNTTMMRMLAERLAVPVEPVEAVGLDGDMLEAQAFAYLAVRVLRGLPTSAPSTTGCREPVCGGRISYPEETP